MSYLITSIVFAIVQIMVWNIFPRFIRNLIFKMPILAIVANGLGSLMIIYLAGSSAFIGSCNLTASVIFAGYVFTYNELNPKRRKHEKRKGMEIPKVRT